MENDEVEDAGATLDIEKKRLEVQKIREEILALKKPYRAPSFWFGSVTTLLAVAGLIAQGILSSIKSERADLKVEQANLKVEQAAKRFESLQSELNRITGERDALGQDIADLQRQKESATADLTLIIQRRDQELTAGGQVSKFDIEVRFLGGLSPSQRKVFQDAAARWQQILVGDLPPVRVDGEEIDDVLLIAQGVAIDGEGGIQGQAGPTHLRPESAGQSAFLPVKGIMSFDTSDLSSLEKSNRLRTVIFEEMGHVFGFGTLWDRKKLLRGAGSANPVFVGRSAQREYATLIGGASQPVPLEDVGGPGVAEGHWRKSVFGNEAMTATGTDVNKPVSRVTIASFEDLGYVVNAAAADAFTLPRAQSPKPKAD